MHAIQPEQKTSFDLHVTFIMRCIVFETFFSEKVVGVMRDGYPIRGS